MDKLFVTSQDRKEQHKRRRELLFIVLTIAFIILLTYIESHLAAIESLLPFSNEVLIFGLININLILILLLIFLIVRNLVKLIFERRRGILGSKLRTKLVAAFVSLSLIPTAVLFLVAIKFLSSSIDQWFDIKTGTALTSSLEVAQNYYEDLADNAQYYARQISAEITDNRLYEKEQYHYLVTLLTQRQKYFRSQSIEVFFDNRNETLFLKDPRAPDLPHPAPSPKVMEEVYAGKTVSNIQSTASGDLISGIAPLYSQFSPKEVVGIVTINYFVGKSHTERIAAISKTVEEFKQFKLLKNPIKFSYIMMLFIVMLLITFSATWFGLFLAKGITVPIQDLAEATHEIAGGNLDYHIDVHAEDEIGVLVTSFNQMTQDLKKSSEELRQAYVDLDGRRKYMETVLRNVSAGVVSVDRHGIITTINQAAEKMLNIETSKVLYRPYKEVLRPEHLELADELVQEINHSEGNFIEKQIELVIKDRVLAVLVSATLLRDDNGTYLGMVVVFEDLTHIQRAERVAAWREVARRIAHEIKNPLTPVRLSAERLQRKYGDTIEGGSGTVFRECTQTIIEQVDVLKKLVDEFSRFARMPMIDPSPNDLNAVIEDSMILFDDINKHITLTFIRGSDMPMVTIDAEQIKRVMINLIDNAITAVIGQKRAGTIEISTHYDEAGKRVRVDMKDNGPGIATQHKGRLFEPYFSTKKHGTGLGLTIVQSIIADHHGTVRVHDNIPNGTIISFEIPVTQEER